MGIDRKAKFPMHISASFLYYSPMTGTSLQDDGSDQQEGDESLNAGNGEEEAGANEEH